VPQAEQLALVFLNGTAFGMLLFLLAAGLVLMLGVMNIINLAHGSFYMLAGFIGFAVAANTGNFALGILAGVVGYMLPAFYVRMRIGRQIRKFNDQLEGMLTMVSSSLRAGFGLLQALDLAAEQLQPPMSTELHRLLRDTRMGASIEEALENLRQRVGSYDLDVIITAILIQRTVGSNLSEVLDKVAHTIRERTRIRGEINTLTAQKRLSGWIIGLMPAAFVIMMLAINFEYMSVLFTDPVGRLLLILAVVLDIVGILMIVFSARLEFLVRWSM